MGPFGLEKSDRILLLSGAKQADINARNRQDNSKDKPETDKNHIVAVE